MKLDKLIADLQAIAEDLESQDVALSDVEVLAGIQPTYPLTTVVLGAVSGEELSDHMERGLDEAGRKAVWISTSQGVDSFSPWTPYAPKALWEVAR